jgi:hypothetical protein
MAAAVLRLADRKEARAVGARELPQDRRRVLATPRWQGRFQVSACRRVVLLFSAHGLPKKFADRGDPYVEHTKATRDGILARLNVPNRQVLGFQSRTGSVEWIGPAPST